MSTDTEFGALDTWLATPDHALASLEAAADFANGAVAEQQGRAVRFPLFRAVGVQVGHFASDGKLLVASAGFVASA